VENTETDDQAPLRTIFIDRAQTRFGEIDVESLIELDHPARLVWEVTGQFDLRRFEINQKSREGNAGRPCWPARLLVSVWVYSYSIGVASARAIERMMAHEPGLRWLTGDQEINHHTLSDFRVGDKGALEDVFTQLLALLDMADLIDLRRLLQDGTKIKAVAGSGSLHRRRTVEKRVREARKLVKKLDAAAESEEMDKRRESAQRRAAREALRRAEAALEKLKKRMEETPAKERDEVRVSVSEPEARKMKQGDGGWAPSYNVQVSTEAKSRMIVAIDVTTAMNDTQQLMPALERIQQTCGAPEQIIADNGYATRSNVEETAKAGVELIAPWKEDEAREAGACVRNGIAAEFAGSKFRVEGGGKELVCPEGKKLVVIGQKKHHGTVCQVYEAGASDCEGCKSREQCCGERKGPRRVERGIESAAMREYQKRMKRLEIRELYKKRSEIAEYPHMWAKGSKKWRRFSVRGVVKAGMEATWVALSYNISQWMRLGLAKAA
jgi:transposase